jgi:hypothetical protein
VKKYLVIALILVASVAFARSPDHGATTFEGLLTANDGIEATDIITKGPWVDVRAYASFSSAITSIGATETTLLIPNEQAVAASATAPATMELMFLQNGSLAMDTGVVVTINNPIDAGLHQIFSGSGTASLVAVMEVYPEWWGAAGDGVTDDTTVFEKTQTALTNGGKVKLANKTYVVNDLNLQSNIEFEGSGYTTKLLATTNNVFFNLGVHPAQLGSYTNYNLSAITAGDITATFSTNAEADNFTVGDLAFLRSITNYNDGGNVSPVFFELVKIIAVGDGTVTFELPIDLDVSDPQIALPRSTDEVVENSSIHDMTLHCDVTANAPLRFRNAYKTHFYNLHTYGESLLLGNALAHVTIDNIVGEYFTSAFEIKLGSYDVLISNSIGFSSANTLSMPALSAGEMARNITFTDINILAKNTVYEAAILKAGGWVRRNIKFNNINASVEEAWYGVYVSPARSTDVYNIEFSDIRLEANKITEPVRIFANSTTGSLNNILINNVKYSGATTQVTDCSDPVAGWYLSESAGKPTGSLKITNNDINGSLNILDGAAFIGMSFTNNRYTGYDTNITHLHRYNIEDNIRQTEYIFRENVLFGTGTVSSNATTANTAVATYTVDAGANWEAGDVVLIYIPVEFSGANSTKSVAIGDSTGTIATFTIPTTNGDGVIRGRFTVLGDSAYFGYLVWDKTSAENEAVVIPRTGLTLSASGEAFTVQGWVANASDTISFRGINIWSELYGD